MASAAAGAAGEARAPAWETPEVIEVFVVADTVEVRSWVSEDADPVGVLHRHDAVIARAAPGAGGVLRRGDFLFLEAGSCVRRLGRADEEFLQLGARGGWLPWELGNGQRAVSTAASPSSVSRYVVNDDRVVSRACPHPGADIVRSFARGDVVDIVEDLPLGWGRCIDRCSGRGVSRGLAFRSSFVLVADLEFRTLVPVPKPDAELAARAVEEARPSDAAEMRVTAEFVFVLARPSLNAAIVGVLKAHDVVTAVPRCEGDSLRWAERTSAGFLQLHAGTWVRQRREWNESFQLESEGWALWTMPNSSQPLLSRVESGKSVYTPTQTPVGSIADCVSCSCSSIEESTVDRESLAADHKPEPPPAASPEPVPPVRFRPAAYCGICDLKVDLRQNRVVVLELGNYKTSCFSGEGACIAKKFTEEYRIVKQLSPGFFVDNKRTTHEMFKDCGFQHLRPKQMCYPRHYTPNLANQIRSEFRAAESLVLKLINRTRGAGVVVVRPSELDAKLWQLLDPPRISSRKFTLDAAVSSKGSSFEEHCRHWWSNESPCFVVEECVASEPICLDGTPYDAEPSQDCDAYDATMRVGFVLVRGGGRTDMELGVEFLGGYWKLPTEPVTSKDLRAKCVSKARVHTAPVTPPEYLERVYDELREALPAVFAPDKSLTTWLTSNFKRDKEMCAFGLAHKAAETLARSAKSSSAKGTRLLQEAQGQISDSTQYTTDKKGPFCRNYHLSVKALQSYVERQLGVERWQADDFGEAQAHWFKALDYLPSNATAEYFIGRSYWRSGKYGQARECFVRSLCLDPDFKAPYVCLGYVLLELRDLDDAIRVSRAGLDQFDRTYGCAFNWGLALALKLDIRFLKGPNQVHGRAHDLADADSESERDELEELQAIADDSATQLRQAREWLRHAKDQKELFGEQLKTDWSRSHEELLGTLDRIAETLANSGTDAHSRLEAKDLKGELTRRLKGMRGWTLWYFRP